MGSTFPAGIWLATMPLVLCAVPAARAATEELGNGFRHHGVATPISNHRGTVATVDGQGHDVVLSWLRDHRGCYELLLVDVETGTAVEYPLPFPVGDDPFASVLSSRNKYYTHFNSHFVEFDPAKRAFTFFHKTAPQMAMSMTEDDRGLIWSATYPQSGLVSFDPQTRDFHDYGQVYKQNWAQYPRAIAADDAGWIYVGVGSTLGQILTFDPRTGKATPVVPEEQRVHGYASVYRDLDGKVYGQPAGDRADQGFVLYKGQVTAIGKREGARPKPIITGSQALFHREFPDGKRLRSFDLVERSLVVEDPKAGTSKTVRFDYRSEGAHIMGLATAPDGTIGGGTAFPMRFFRFDPAADTWTNHAAFGQFNTVARQGDRFFAGGYGGGFLLEWDPSKPWVTTQRGSKTSNPRFLIQVSPTIHRPHRLLAHPDGKTLVMGGTPDYGYTGGGLLIWDRETEKHTLLTDKELIPDQSTMALVAVPGGKLLGGTTTSPGTGGEKKAKEAELYLLDVATKRLDWHAPLFAGAQTYTDMAPAPNGLVYGFADRTRFFVFDPTQRKVVHEADTGAVFGPTASQQGPRVFIPGPKGETYVLFVKGIGRVDPRTHQITLLAASPVPADCGGDILKGRLYFASGSHVYSYALPE